MPPLPATPLPTTAPPPVATTTHLLRNAGPYNCIPKDVNTSTANRNNTDRPMMTRAFFRTTSNSTNTPRKYLVPRKILANLNKRREETFPLVVWHQCQLESVSPTVKQLKQRRQYHHQQQYHIITTITNNSTISSPPSPSPPTTVPVTTPANNNSTNPVVVKLPAGTAHQRRPPHDDDDQIKRVPQIQQITFAAQREQP
jgi:hypothetical protein